MSSACFFAESMITGRRAVAASERRRRQSSRPFRLGMLTSVMMRCGFWRLISRSASKPSVAVVTTYPCFVRKVCTSLRICPSSSTKSTRSPAMGQLAAGRSSATRLRSSAIVKGFGRTPAPPCSAASWICARWTDAVTKMTGIFAVSGESFSASPSWKPSRFGIETSLNTRSGCTFRMSASPSAPSAAMWTSWPLPRIAASMSFWIIGSSSQNTILPIPPSLYPHGHERQRELEGRPLARGALDPCLPAVHLDDLTRDREAQPGALDVAGRPRLEARESLEHLLDRVGRDTEAGVADEHVGEGAFHPRRHRDRAAAGRVLHRVGEQVEQDLVHLVLVDLDEGQLGIEVELDRVTRRVRGEPPGGFGDDRVEIGELLVERHPARLHPVEIE